MNMSRKDTLEFTPLDQNSFLNQGVASSLLVLLETFPTSLLTVVALLVLIPPFAAVTFFWEGLPTLVGGGAFLDATTTPPFADAPDPSMNFLLVLEIRSNPPSPALLKSEGFMF